MPVEALQRKPQVRLQSEPPASGARRVLVSYVPEPSDPQSTTSREWASELAIRLSFGLKVLSMDEAGMLQDMPPDTLDAPSADARVTDLVVCFTQRYAVNPPHVFLDAIEQAGLPDGHRRQAIWIVKMDPNPPEVFQLGAPHMWHLIKGSVKLPDGSYRVAKSSKDPCLVTDEVAMAANVIMQHDMCSPRGAVCPRDPPAVVAAGAQAADVGRPPSPLARFIKFFSRTPG